MPQISATTSIIASARNEMSVSTVSTIAMPSSRWPGGRREVDHAIATLVLAYGTDPVARCATDVSFAIIEALRPWSSAVYRGKGCAGAQREDVEHGRRRSNKVQVKDLMPYSLTLAPSQSRHALRL
jgi:hypothetical protein